MRPTIRAGVTRERSFQRTIRQSPDSDRLIVTAARQQLPVWTERDEGNSFRMGESLRQLAFAPVPELYGSIHASAGEVLSIRTEDDPPHHCGMSFQRFVWLRSQCELLDGFLARPE